MKNFKVLAIVFALMLALGGVACGDVDDENGNGGDGNDSSEQEESSSDDPTVTKNEYVDACVENAETCDESVADRSDCEDQWDFDLANAKNPGACVDASTEGWECLVENDCGDGPECQQIFVDIGNYCAPE